MDMEAIGHLFIYITFFPKINKLYQLWRSVRQSGDPLESLLGVVEPPFIEQFTSWSGLKNTVMAFARRVYYSNIINIILIAF